MSHVVLVGLMGSGKTSVGIELAALLGRPFSDSDSFIQGITGTSVRQIAEEGGASAVHGYEEQHLLQALTAEDATVIAAAASVVERPACVAALQSAEVVWLKVPIETLTKRFDSAHHRPIYGEPSEVLPAQAMRRESIYARLATLVCEYSEMDPRSAARWIADRLQS